MNTQIAADEKRHPIQVVGRRTGLSADVLRVWEKRYGVVEPGRSPGGHRLYSDEDVERLLLLNRVTSAGRRISRMAGLDSEELRRLVDEDAAAAVAARETVSPPIRSEPYLVACLSAVDRMDARDLETALMRASVALPATALIEEVVGPLLERIGERWRHGKITPGHEHLASSVIRRVLESIMNACAPGDEAPGIVVTTPAGQVHEFGALLVGAAAAALGWRVTYLGASLPAPDIAAVAKSAGARAIALSIVYPNDDPTVAEELRSLRRAVDPAVEILVGGRAAASYGEAIEAIEATRVTDLVQLISFLEDHAPDRRDTDGQPG
jgi:DNA-binding transcriptional MerR regulator/methylmalonyl-CoA mutase cobalamin-binding subunit